MIRATRIGLQMKTCNFSIWKQIGGGARCNYALCAPLSVFPVGLASASSEMWFGVRFDLKMHHEKRKE